MKNKKIFTVLIFFLFILTLSAVSAEDSLTADSRDSIESIQINDESTKEILINSADENAIDDTENENISYKKDSNQASNKSYKASAKTKTLTGTFKTANGNVVKGKKISFTINGKTYTATTNAKGVASVKVSLSKKGTYTCTAKFNGDTTFKATSTKFKVTIK